MEYNRRAYQRGSHFSCDAKISPDGKSWIDASISDLSSGGASLSTAEGYEVGDIIWFDLSISGFLSEFKVKTQGIIRRLRPFMGEFVYGVEFVGLSPDLKIRIDENVLGDRIVSRGSYESEWDAMLDGLK